MELNFPKRCDFCTSRIGSRHCLLPYNFVIKYTPPTETKDALIDLAQLHMEFGLESLIASYEFICRITTRPTKEQIHSYAESLSSQSTDRKFFPDSYRFGYMKPSEESTVTSEFLRSPEKETVDNSTTEEIETAELSESHPSTSMKVDDDSTSATTTVNVDDTTPSMAEILKRSPPTTEATDTIQTEPTQTEIQETHSQKNLKSGHLQHIAHDLFMAMSCAWALNATKKSTFLMSQLHECIFSELQKVERYGEYYHYQDDTRLDHPIALSREIIATHDDTEVREHQYGRSNDLQKYCLLQHSLLQINNSNSSTLTISNGLISYIQSVMRSQAITRHDRDILSTMTKELTTKRGFALAYQWSKTKVLATKTQTSTSSSHLKLALGTKPTPTLTESIKIASSAYSKHAHHVQHETGTSSPTPNEMNGPLYQIIDKILDENPNLRSRTPFTELPLRDVYHQLITSLITHNRGWMNPNTLTTNQSIQKIESHCSFTIPDTELPIALKVMKHIQLEASNQFKGLAQSTLS